jgi:autotransporter-associated beta strand protein
VRQLDRLFCGLLCASVMAAVGGTPARASTPAPAVTGGFSVFPVATATAPVQLLVGTDGRQWFVTAQSQLGLISSTGQITLLPLTLPHGNVTAALVGAGPEGVWAYGNTTGTTPSCTVSLTNTGGVITQRTLTHPAASLCYGGARDASGNGWFSIHGAQTGSGVSRMVRLSQTGQVTTILPDRAGARPGAVALGSDGAIWALEFDNHSYGRYTATAPATTVSIGGSETPPYPGSIFFGVNPHQLLPRADGTFWLLGYNVILSDPGKWLVRYLFEGHEFGATTPDGALWSVFSDRAGPPAERMVRMDVTGRFDRSATLPAGTTGAPMMSTGPIAATPDGSIWTVTSDGANTYVVRYQPTALTHVAIWTGAGGDSHWSTAANWQGDTPPVTGDAVELPIASTMVDDLPGLRLEQLLLTGPAHLSGAALSIGAGGLQVKSAVTASIANPLTTGSSGLQVVADPRATLTLSGVISGTGGLAVRGAGLVVLTADNTYSGTTDVRGGDLEIDGFQPASSVTVGETPPGLGGQLSGGGTTGSVTIADGYLLTFGGNVAQSCPLSLSIHGDLVLGAYAIVEPAIVACASPAHQAATRIKVTGSVSIAHSGMLLDTQQDAASTVCLISSQGPITGTFAGVAEGSTEPDYGADAGDVVRFSYMTPGGPGCFAHAFTAQTGIDP